MEYVLQTDNLTKVYGKNKVVDGVSMHVKKGDIYGFIGKNGAGKTTFMRMAAGLAAPTTGSIRLFESEELEKQRLGLAIALLRSPDFLILDEPINGLDPAGIKEIRELLLKLNQEKNMTILISSHILGELSKIATRYGIIREGVLIEEFDSSELEEKCRRCHKLVVNDTEKTVQILEDKLNILTYDVPEENIIRIFDHLDETAKINRNLIEEGIDVKESFLAGQDLEGYFMDLLGGEKNV